MKPMDLKGSMELAGRNLVANLCPTRNYLPYWAIDIDSGYGARARFNWPQHNVGRWWDAMLRLEAATGFRIPPDREAAMLGNLHSFFDNPDQSSSHDPSRRPPEPGFRIESHPLVFRDAPRSASLRRTHGSA